MSSPLLHTFDANPNKSIQQVARFTSFNQIFVSKMEPYNPACYAKKSIPNIPIINNQM
jgi:hypothetical protein